MSLAESLERAAAALPAEADAIRPANGDAARLLGALEPDAAARVLGWLLVEEPAAGEELAEAWAELPGGEAPLRRLPESGLPKAARKGLRRVLHRLRSRGVALEREPAQPFVASLPRMEDELSGALVSAVDPSGAQLLVLVEASPTGGARLFEAVIDDERGLLEFQAFTTTRSRARHFLRDLASRERGGAVAAPPAAVRVRLARALANHPADRTLPEGFSEWRARVATAPEGACSAGELAREALPNDTTPERLRRAVELVESGELGPWPPSGERLRAFADKLQGAARSRIVVSDVQRRERLGELLGELAGDRFAGEGAAHAAARCEETAYVLWNRGREDDACACLAAASAFRSGPLEQNPVARAMLERALRPVLEALREEERSSLLVKP